MDASFFKGLYHLCPGAKLLMGHITTDGSDDPDEININGVASAARATNRYTLTLKSQYRGIYAAMMLPRGAAPEGFQATGTDVDAVGGGTIAFDAGATYTSEEIYFLILLKDREIG